MTISTAIAKIQQRKIESIYNLSSQSRILASAALILIFNFLILGTQLMLKFDSVSGYS